MCKPLYETSYASITCKLGDVELPHCREPLEGTIARFKCPNSLPDVPLVCKNGKWNDNMPNCNPSKKLKL